MTARGKRRHAEEKLREGRLRTWETASGGKRVRDEKDARARERKRARAGNKSPHSGSAEETKDGFFQFLRIRTR